MNAHPGSVSGSLLVVDDAAEVREMIADSLRRQGHRVETAVDCGDAIARLSECHFDAVLCDVSLPDRDGYHLLAWAVAHRPETPILMLTGFGTIDGAVEAIRRGASEYLTKPLLDDEIASAVSKALGRRRLRQPAPELGHRHRLVPEEVGDRLRRSEIGRERSGRRHGRTRTGF